MSRTAVGSFEMLRGCLAVLCSSFKSQEGSSQLLAIASGYRVSPRTPTFRCRTGTCSVHAQDKPRGTWQHHSQAQKLRDGPCLAGPASWRAQRPLQVGRWCLSQAREGEEGRCR